MRQLLDPTAVFTRRRLDMVDDQLIRRGIDDSAVLDAMREVPRQVFVLESDRELAYQDRPLFIGLGQTISQPYIVALMTQLAQITPGLRVLDVGTGSGYQAAILAKMGARVDSIEILPTHAARARHTLDTLGLTLPVHVTDGADGWPEKAPYDAILVAAAPRQVPQPLLDQLDIGGRLLVPVGDLDQELLYIKRTEHGWTRKRITTVAFVPMTGKAELSTQIEVAEEQFDG
jgi:protein-L-isoaspartate(D-aspartate) O-methyltransferase